MEKKIFRRAGLCLLVAFVAILAFSQPANAFTQPVDSVANLTTVSAIPIPSGWFFRLNSVVVGNPNASSSCCARVFRGGTAVTGFIVVPAGGSVQVNFDPPIYFSQGQTVGVRNGASSGPLHFNVIGDYGRVD